VLTRSLLPLAPASLDAVEIDRDLAAALRQDLTAAHFVLHEADALTFDYAALARERGAPLRILGNLPYNLSPPLVFHLLSDIASIRDLHVMLQREVVARITAHPGTHEYGRLTVMLAPWVVAERLFDIGPGAFQPPPRVWSALVRLTVREHPAFNVHPRFGDIVATAFMHRRKTLRNALQTRLGAAEIEACGIDPGARPETLEPEAFNRLAAAADAATPRPSPRSPPMR
jgi:16S rRNA (adenine1518-N6/adenine1519-N6)-dimethyltransferase